MAVGSVLSIIGALVLFFSWIATNAFGEKLKAARSAMAEARTHYRQASNLNEIQGSLRSLQIQITNMEHNIYSLKRADPDPRSATHLAGDYMRLRQASAASSAGQIDGGIAFCQTTLDLAAAANCRSRPALETTYAEMRSLRKKVESILLEATELIRSKVVGESEKSSFENLLTMYSQDLLPNFGPLLIRAVDQSNEIQRQMDEQVQKATKSDRTAKRVANTFYVIGTVLVLSGTAFDKIIDPHISASKTTCAGDISK